MSSAAVNEELRRQRDRLHDISNTIASMNSNIAVAQVERAAMREDLLDLKEQLRELTDAVNGITDTANRWKGGFLVVAGLGGAVGWLVSSWEDILKLLRVL